MRSTVVTNGLTPVERLELWHDVVCRSLVSLDLAPAEPEWFTARLTTEELGRLTVVDLASQPQDVFRTRRLIATDTERYFKIAIVLDGRCVVSQHGREALLGPGDLVCYDTAAPYEFHIDRPFRLGVFMLPETGAQHRLRGFGTMTATRIRPEEGLGIVASPVLRQFITGIGKYGGAGSAHAGEAVVDLLAGLVAERVSREADEDAARTASLVRVHRHIELNLADPDLSPAGIAAAAGVSLRYLYKLFAGEGTTVSAWVRNRRLDQVRRDLRDPRLAHCTIAGLAARWGFPEPAHFSRAFRASEGVSPQEFRRAALGKKS